MDNEEMKLVRRVSQTFVDTGTQGKRMYEHMANVMNGRMGLDKGVPWSELSEEKRAEWEDCAETIARLVPELYRRSV